MFVHSPELRNQALALVEAGENDCQVARRLGLARTTVRDWRRAKDEPSELIGVICPRCWRPSRKPILFTVADYAELLGLYLGDGYIVRTGRSDRLRIFLDTRYGQIVADTESLLRRCFPAHRVGRFHDPEGDDHNCQPLLHPPCLPLPAARCRYEARAGHRARGLADRARRA